MSESLHALDRLKGVCQVLSTSGPFVEPGAFQPGSETIRFVRHEAKVLVIGAGGLGCEILKNLALSGFACISVIDMDTVDVTNLNRQFLFRPADVGKPKAVVAADFINKRFSHLGVRVTPIVGMIQSHPPEFYSQFFLIISGLDNIEARRWINSVLHDCLQTDDNGVTDPSSIRFLLDGGTEGLKGQARVIIPSITACFECTLDSFPPQTNYPICTIAETPRLPEHCIEYALLVEWPKQKPDIKPNFDSPDDVGWLFESAKIRAESFGIVGVTYTLTLGVVKRIIPAVASTNAIISGLLVTEALKIASYANPVMDNYMMFMGQSGTYCHTFQMEKKLDCAVCGSQNGLLRVARDETLSDLILNLMKCFKLTEPSITSGKNVLFMQRPSSLRALHEHKLGMTLDQLVAHGEIRDGDILTVTDPVLVRRMTIELRLL